MEYWILRENTRVVPVLHVFNDEGVMLFATGETTARVANVARKRRGVIRAECRIPGHYFAEGRVFVTPTVATWHPRHIVHVYERDAVSFEVLDGSDGTGVRGSFGNHWPGVVRPMFPWVT